MHDVARRAGVFEKGSKPPGTFGFDGFRTARLVPLGPGLSLLQQLLLQPADEFSVLAMSRDDDAELLASVSV